MSDRNIIQGRYDSEVPNDRFNTPSGVYPTIPPNPIASQNNNDIPRNPIGLPDTYPQFGPNIRIDRVYPPGIECEHHHHHHHHHPDAPDLGNYPGNLMGPEHPYFHKHEHTPSPFPPPPEGKNDGSLFAVEDANIDSLGRGDICRSNLS